MPDKEPRAKTKKYKFILAKLLFFKSNMKKIITHFQEKKDRNKREQAITNQLSSFLVIPPRNN